MAGPKAPKDPTAKGSSFYICRQKNILGNPTPDGKGVQFIYLNDGRLITFAKMIGNVEDEIMLNNLASAEKFREMVAGIGVTIETEDANQLIDFVFQFYGKTDPNHSGNTITISCKPDGMENIIWLDDYEWLEDNDVVGQMRFLFEKAETFATIDVKLYLREGFTAPEQEECGEIDITSPYYQEMMDKSVMNIGNYSRLKAVIDKAKAGEEVTIAFIGGSITQGAGAIPIHKKSYAYQTWEKWKEAYGDNVKLIKAGVGGTSSEFGMVRFDRDVLRNFTVVPDLVVIEFAVNDEGDETKGTCYESLIRKALAVSDHTAVVLIFAVFANDWNLEERLGPVGERYELPMVSVKRAVVEQFYKKSGEGRVLAKSQFFYDSYHPTNMGHTIMADCLMKMFRTVDGLEQIADIDYRTKETVMGTDFEKIQLIDKICNAEKLVNLQVGSFTETDTNLQCAEMDDVLVPVAQMPNNWHHVSGSDALTMTITCKALVIVTKDSGEVTYGKAVAMVDGKEVRVLDPREVGWTHCNSQILFSEKETKTHEVSIAMQKGDEDKLFTILAFGFVE